MDMYEVVVVSNGQVLARNMSQKVAMLMASVLYKRYPDEEFAVVRQYD